LRALVDEQKKQNRSIRVEAQLYGASLQPRFDYGSVGKAVKGQDELARLALDGLSNALVCIFLDLDSAVVIIDGMTVFY